MESESLGKLPPVKRLLRSPSEMRRQTQKRRDLAKKRGDCPVCFTTSLEGGPINPRTGKPFAACEPCRIMQRDASRRYYAERKRQQDELS
jgi:transcription elongation factor Elf1